MTAADDHEDMRAKADERLLAGADVPGQEALVDVVAAMRRLADAPAPPPSPALAALLRDGHPARARAAASLPITSAASASTTTPARTAASSPITAPAPGWWDARARAVARWAAGLGVAAKVLLGAGVAVAAVTGAATLPGVPDAVREPTRAVLGDLAHALEPGDRTPLVPTSTPTTRPTRDSADHAGTDEDATSNPATPAPGGAAPTPARAGSTPPPGTHERSDVGPSTPRRTDGSAPTGAPSPWSIPAQDAPGREGQDQPGRLDQQPSPSHQPQPHASDGRPTH